jgi:hypothetical protein
LAFNCSSSTCPKGLPGVDIRIPQIFSSPTCGGKEDSGPQQHPAVDTYARGARYRCLAESPPAGNGYGAARWDSIAQWVAARRFSASVCIRAKLKSGWFSPWIALDERYHRYSTICISPASIWTCWWQ